MLNKYRDIQPFFYNFIMSSFHNNKISHAYLIETKNISYGIDLAIDLAKFFLCDGIYDKKICDAIDNNSYGDFKTINSDSEIKKDDIMDLKHEFSLSSSENKTRVYLIKNSNLLNKSSANSLLKFLEEPEKGIVAILVTDNIEKVIETIISRCQIISLINNEVFDYKTIFSYYDYEIHGDYEEFIKNESNLFFEFYSCLETNSFDFLVKFKCYDFNNRIKCLLNYGLYLYMDVLNFKLKIEKRYLPNSNLNDFVLKNEINDIIEKIDIINDFLYKSSFNVNLNLFMDNFVISMKGVK